MTTIHNLCAECGQDFGSIQAFDRHRRGDAADRHCLALSEFAKHDLVRNKRGCWSIGKNLKQIRSRNADEG